MILFLLVTCKNFSQTNTKDSVVVLSETTSRKVIKDLVKLDACLQIQKEQNTLIEIQKEKINKLNEITTSYSEISFEKSLIIDNQKKIIEDIKKPKLHLYIGVRNELFNLEQSQIYSNFLFCSKKFEIGVQANLQTIGTFTYGLIGQYKVF